MGLISAINLKSVDTLHNTANVLAGATNVLVTLTGKGMMNISQKGDGGSAVNMQYIVDGGVPVTIGAATVEAILSVGFQTSLVIQSVNTNVSAGVFDSTISWTGVYQ